jgi:hypothetical protein
MDEAALKAEWQDFAKRLWPVGMTIFGGTPIKVTEQGSADVRIVGLMLLVRTLNNLKAAIAVTEAGLIVEAKVIARCCFEKAASSQVPAPVCDDCGLPMLACFAAIHARLALLTVHRSLLAFRLIWKLLKHVRASHSRIRIFGLNGRTTPGHDRAKHGQRNGAQTKRHESGPRFAGQVPQGAADRRNNDRAGVTDREHPGCSARHVRRQT